MRPVRTAAVAGVLALSGLLSGLSSAGATPAPIQPIDVVTLPCQLLPAGCPIPIRGTDGPDEIIGTNGPDIIYAGGGNDRIYGLGGNDIIYGEGGDDHIWGDAGDDEIRGGRGEDTSHSEPSYAYDYLVGGGGSESDNNSYYSVEAYDY